MKVHAKKGALGYSPVEPSEAYTHWIISRDEFDKLIKEKESYTTLYQHYKNKAESLQTERDKYYEIARTNKLMLEEYELKQNEIAQQEHLSNENAKTIEDVLRIVKERANKDRRIKNKKEDSGYILLKTENFFDKNKKQKYRTKIQTPFFAEFEQDKFEALLAEDLLSYLLTIGIKDCNKDIIKTRDFSSGYWTITITHQSEVILND